ncbi:MAG: phage holin family protein [Thermoleophilia bacterium]|nr:phage holin family protein [Thermoleophilia bacterium]
MNLRERVVASVTDIRERGQRLVQLNLELLTSELKAKGRKFGAAIGLFVGAGVLAFYAVGFALATIAAALALVVPLWLSLLIVTVVIVLIIAIMVAVGRGQIEKARTPAPETALAEARKTADLVKTNLRQTRAGVRAKVASARATPRAGRGPHGPGAAPPRPDWRAGAAAPSSTALWESPSAPSAPPSEPTSAPPASTSESPAAAGEAPPASTSESPAAAGEAPPVSPSEPPSDDEARES